MMARPVDANESLQGASEHPTYGQMLLRVLYVTACAEGGVSKYLRLHAERLPAMGIELSIAGPGNSQLSKMVSGLPHINYIDLPLQDGPSLFSDLHCLFLLARIVQRGSYDIVHSHHVKGGTLVAALSRLIKGRLVYNPHGVMAHHVPARWVGRFYPMVERWASSHHDMVIAICRTERQEVISLGLGNAHNTVVVYNGVERQETGADRLQAAESGCSERKGPVIGTACRLHRCKGADCLIRAVGMIHRSYPEMRVLIAGDGPMREELAALVRSEGLERTVRLLGHVSDLSSFFSEIDLFVHPARWDSFPLAILEAGMAGVPVVATNVGGICELIDDSSGWLVSQGKHSELAEALAGILSDPAEAARRASQLHARVLERHHADAMVRGTQGVYQQLSQSNRDGDRC